jgi:hypothetical protein
MTASHDPIALMLRTLKNWLKPDFAWRPAFYFRARRCSITGRPLSGDVMVRRINGELQFREESDDEYFERLSARAGW